MNVHPKVQAGAIAGVVYAIIVAVANYYGVDPNPTVLAAAGSLVPVVAGYLKSGPAPATAPQPEPAISVSLEPFIARIVSDLEARVTRALAAPPAQTVTFTGNVAAFKPTPVAADTPPSEQPPAA